MPTFLIITVEETCQAIQLTYFSWFQTNIAQENGWVDWYGKGEAQEAEDEASFHDWISEIIERA